MFGFRICIFGLLAFLLQNVCLGKSLSFSRLTVENGLSNNQVNTIYKDSLGFVWFGTLDGLDRFDGTEIRSYASKFPEAVENIYAIAEDLTHDLWVGTSSGLFCFNEMSDQFEKVQLDSSSISVNVLNVLPDNSLLVGTADGLYILSHGKPEHVVFGPHKSDLQNTITGIFTDNHDNCWLSTLGGLVCYSWKNKKTELFRFNKAGDASYNSFSAICNIRNTIYLGTNNSGLVEFDLVTKTFSQSINIGTNIILNLASDHSDHLFVGTNGAGLKIVDLYSRQVETLENKESDPLSLSSNSIYSFYLDESNRYWVGTYSGGVNYSQRLNGKFELHPISMNYPMASKSIRSFYFAPNGMQYFGTRRGVVQIDPNGNAKFYNADDPSLHGLRSNIILSVYPFKHNILIGTYGGGVSMLDVDNQKIVPFLNGDDFLHGNVYGFDTDSEGNLWISTFNGLYRYSPETKGLINYNESNSGLVCDNVFDIAFDSQGRLWVGTMKGCFLFSIEGSKLIPVDFPASAIVRNNFKVNYIYEDMGGNIWICTEWNGLIMVDPSLKSAKVYYENDGLPDNSVCAIIESSPGLYWISTLRGFCRFNLQLNQFTRYSLSDGLPGLVFSPAAAYMSNNGTVMFGNEKGLIYFTPKNVEQATPNAKVRLTGFYVLGEEIKPGPQSVLKQPIETVAAISLTDRLSSIGFRFVALNYANPADNHYFCKLEGYDKDWQDNGSNTSIFYKKLKPGDYTFNVCLSDQGDHNFSNATTIKVHVKRSLIKSPLIIIVIIVLIVEVLFLLANYIKSLNNVIKKVIEKTDKTEKYKGSRLTEGQSHIMVNDLRKYMQEKKPYLNAELKLADLATGMNCSVHDISQVLNQSLNQSFSDFVNSYRIEEVKQRLARNDYERFTLLAIAMQCGFNSKTSFYRIFKNETGMTPSDYLKEQKGHA